MGHFIQSNGEIRNLRPRRRHVEVVKKERTPDWLTPALVAVVVIVTIIIMLMAFPRPAGAQEATIVPDEAGIELRCENGIVRIDATTSPQISPEFPPQCTSSDGVELLNLVFFCDTGSSGAIQAWTDDKYTGYFTVYLSVGGCQMGHPKTFKQVFCDSPTGTAYINLPIYNEGVEEMHVWCEWSSWTELEPEIG